MMAPREDYSFANSKAAPRFLAFSRSVSESPPRDNDTSFRVRTALPFLQIALPRGTPKSIFQIEGDVKMRALLRIPEIPIQYGTEVLSNTVVQIGVQPDGFPFSARIITSSGSATADRKALEIANHLRFAPLPLPDSRNPNELQWGECVFQWFTTEPPAASPRATNASSATLSSTK
jgi:TonB family protein